MNKHCKSFIKRLLSEWYLQQIENQLSHGKKVEEIDIQFRLTTVKPLHGKCLVKYYNEITSQTGSPIIINGWKAAETYNALEISVSGLPSTNLFEDISPLGTTYDSAPVFVQ